MTTTAHQSTLRGVLTIDGKEQQIAARDLQFRAEFERPRAQGARGPIPMGLRVNESFSFSNGTLTTSVTIRDQDGRTTTTTTTSDDDSTTTTTTTTDADGNSSTTIVTKP
jgi:hypothetical protein